MYISLLIISFFTISLIRGLLTPDWKLQQASKERSIEMQAFWLIITVCLLITLKHSYFGNRISALAGGLTLILLYEVIQGISRLLTGWSLSRISPILEKLVAVGELVYFGLLIVALFGGPVGQDAQTHQIEADLASSGLDLAAYQADPAKFLENGKTRWASQLDEMKKIKDEAEVQKAIYQNSGKSNSQEAVSAVDRLERSIDNPLTAGARFQEELEGRSTIDAAEAERFLKALEESEGFMQKVRQALNVLQEHYGR